VRELFHETAAKATLKPLDVGLTQRDIREKIKWTSASTIREGLRKLVMFEYLLVVKGGSRGMRNSYSLVADEPMERLDCSMIPDVEEIKRQMEQDEIF
jgi:hypothetical protein